jgi:hypothetical protein
MQHVKDPTQQVKFEEGVTKAHVQEAPANETEAPESTNVTEAPVQEANNDTEVTEAPVQEANNNDTEVSGQDAEDEQ